MKCDAKNTSYGYTCTRPVGHDGWHVQVRGTSTVAWPTA